MIEDICEIDAMQGLVNELCAYMIEYEDFESFEYVKGVVEMFNLDCKNFNNVEDAML